MASIKRHVVLLDQTTAGSGPWIQLDNRYEEDSTRIIQVDLAVGDTIVLEGTTKSIRGQNPATTIASLQANDISAIQTFTADGNGDLLNGPWSFIRITKTGVTGNAKVQGFI